MIGKIKPVHLAYAWFVALAVFGLCAAPMEVGAALAVLATIAAAFAILDHLGIGR